MFTVALLQMTSHGLDVEANLAKGAEWCRRAAAMGADLALFPEMWSVGYAACPADEAGAEAWRARAVGPESEYVTRFRELARELDMVIAATYLEAWEGPPRNTVSLIDRHGELALTYAKVHTCDFGNEASLTPGERFEVVTIDMREGPLKLGAMICYDREFPESARVLMLGGAEIIVVPNACTLGHLRLGQLQVRAAENMVGIAMTNYARPEANGHSCAFDAEVFKKVDEDVEHDTTIVMAGEREGTYLAPFDLARLRAYRERETWGNAYRKPRAYGALVEEQVEPPFVRSDARR